MLKIYCDSLVRKAPDVLQLFILVVAAGIYVGSAYFLWEVSFVSRAWAARKRQGAQGRVATVLRFGARQDLRYFDRSRRHEHRQSSCASVTLLFNVA